VPGQLDATILDPRTKETGKKNNRGRSWAVEEENDVSQQEKRRKKRRWEGKKRRRGIGEHVQR
jgi:hypothetical protein